MQRRAGGPPRSASCRCGVCEGEWARPTKPPAVWGVGWADVCVGRVLRNGGEPVGAVAPSCVSTTTRLLSFVHDGHAFDLHLSAFPPRECVCAPVPNHLCNIELDSSMDFMCLFGGCSVPHTPAWHRREVLISSIARMHCTCEWLQRGAVRTHHYTRQVASRTKINRSLRTPRSPKYHTLPLRTGVRHTRVCAMRANPLA